MQAQVFPKLPEPIIDWQMQQQINDEATLQKELNGDNLSLRQRRFYERRLVEVQESQLATLDALHEKFTALAANESLDAKRREHSREVLGRVDQSISGLRRSAA